MKNNLFTQKIYRIFGITVKFIKLFFVSNSSDYEQSMRLKSNESRRKTLEKAY